MNIIDSMQHFSFPVLVFLLFLSLFFMFVACWHKKGFSLTKNRGCGQFGFSSLGFQSWPTFTVEKKKSLTGFSAVHLHTRYVPVIFLLKRSKIQVTMQVITGGVRYWNKRFLVRYDCVMVQTGSLCLRIYHKLWVFDHLSLLFNMHQSVALT